MNVGVLNIVPEVSEVVLISFNSFFLSDSLISTILSSTSLILSSASVILLLVPSRIHYSNPLWILSPFLSKESSMASSKQWSQNNDD